MLLGEEILNHPLILYEQFVIDRLITVTPRYSSLVIFIPIYIPNDKSSQTKPLSFCLTVLLSFSDFWKFITNYFLKTLNSSNFNLSPLRQPILRPQLTSVNPIQLKSILVRKKPQGLSSIPDDPYGFLLYSIYLLRVKATTLSTWLERTEWMSFEVARSRKHIHYVFGTVSRREHIHQSYHLRKGHSY